MSAPDMETTDKASRQLAGWVETVQRGDDWASDLVAWVVNNLRPEAVKGLAQDWDNSSDAPAHWVIKLDDLGEPDAGPADYWSNSDGWTHYIELADHFTDAEKQTTNLPMGGVWVRMEGEPE